MFKFIWQDMDLAHKYDEVPSVSSDKEYQKHYHNFYEIFYFISGTATYTVENEKHLLHPYDGLIIRPGEFHNVEFLDKSPYERYVLKLPAGLMLPYFADKLRKRSAFYPKQYNALELFSGLDKAYELYSGDDLFYYTGSIAMQVVVSFCNSNKVPPDDFNSDSAKIRPVLQYINDNINQPLTLTQIADHFKYSPDYLNREFYRYMKTTIMKYIRTKRIYAAHRLMIGGDTPTHVAEQLGYSDYSAFYRAYVSVMGKSPSQKRTEKSLTFFPTD